MRLANCGIASFVEEECIVLALRGEIDIASIAELQDACDRLRGDQKIIIDAFGLDFIDCSSVGVLAKVANRVPAGMIVARGLQGILFEMAGVHVLDLPDAPTATV